MALRIRHVNELSRRQETLAALPVSMGTPAQSLLRVFPGRDRAPEDIRELHPAVESRVVQTSPGDRVAVEMPDVAGSPVVGCHVPVRSIAGSTTAFLRYPIHPELQSKASNDGAPQGLSQLRQPAAPRPPPIPTCRYDDLDPSRSIPRSSRARKWSGFLGSLRIAQ